MIMLRPLTSKRFQIPIMSSPDSSSHSGDNSKDCIDIVELLIQNPDSTVIVPVHGENFSGQGFSEGDLLVVDRNAQAEEGNLVIVSRGGQFSIERFHRRSDNLQLVRSQSSSPMYSESDVWGVIRFRVQRF